MFVWPDVHTKILEQEKEQTKKGNKYEAWRTSATRNKTNRGSLFTPEKR